VAKEGYKPTSGMQSAARRAIKLKEQGKAKGAGTSVGWTRAGQLARGETLSLSTVKRMYSYFSRHEVDKQGKDWDNAENPSNGKIMWLAWGGDAGFSWSRKIVNREKTMKKNLELNEIVEEIKDILDDVVNPITEVVEIEDGLEKSIDPKPEDDMDEEELSDEEISKNYHSENEDEDKWNNVEKACWSGYQQVGMKDKNGKKVPNCVPVKKVEKIDGQLILSEEERAILEQEKLKSKVSANKSLWNNMFDPYSFTKNIN
jgi:transcription antitermination factor NusG